LRTVRFGGRGDNGRRLFQEDVLFRDRVQGFVRVGVSRLEVLEGSMIVGQDSGDSACRISFYPVALIRLSACPVIG
jgi:hypothetical protein